MAKKKNNILPTGGEQLKPIPSQFQEAIRQTQAGEPIQVAPPEFISEEIEKQRQIFEETGQMPADISTDQVMDGAIGGNLKLQNISAKYFPDLAIEKLGREDYFPGYRPTQEAGAVTGRIIGRQPIFVRSGGLFPFGIVDARKRALERAAQVKLAAQDAFFKGGPDVPAQYDRQMKKIWLDKINDIGRDFDWDFSKAKSDPETIRELTALYSTAREVTFAVKTADGILGDIKKNRFVPEDIEIIASKYSAGGLIIEEEMKNPKKFLTEISKLRSYGNLTNIIRTESAPLLEDMANELVDILPEDIANKVVTTNDYDIIRETLTSFIDVDDLKAEAHHLFTDFDVGQSEEEIFNRLLMHFGPVMKEKLRVQRKFTRRKQPTAIPAQTGFFNIKDVKSVKTTETVDGKEVEKTELQEQIVPIEFAGFYNIAGIKREPTQINILPSTFVNTAEDRVETTLGTTNVDVVAAGTLPVDEKGTIRFGAGGALPKDLSKFTMKMFSVVRVNEETKVTYKNRETGEEVKATIPKGGTRLVSFDKVEQPLKNAKITIEGGQLLFEGESVEGEGGTYNLIFK